MPCNRRTSHRRRVRRNAEWFPLPHTVRPLNGLPEVRKFRLSRCDADESEWRHELQSARQIVPEIGPLLMLRIIKDALNE